MRVANSKPIHYQTAQQPTKIMTSLVFKESTFFTETNKLKQFWSYSLLTIIIYILFVLLVPFCTQKWFKFAFSKWHHNTLVISLLDMSLSSAFYCQHRANVKLDLSRNVKLCYYHQQ